MFPVLYSIGWVLSKLPLFLVKGICYCLGVLFFYVPSKRRHIIYSNLHHAFPERSQEWLRQKVWAISQRTVEMGLFTMACPHFSKERFLDAIEVPDATDLLFKELVERDRPILGLGMHFSMIEPVNAWPGKVDRAYPETTVMYRPHKNPKVDALIKKHRQRFGYKLVSRKEGVRDISVTMRNKGMSIILFDQNTRSAGNLIPFFGRATAATDLPGIIAKKFSPSLLMIVGHRIAFWKGRIEIEELKCELDPVKVTLASNQWLENKLCESDDYLIDWLWSHNRWKILHRPFERLGMDYRKKGIDFSAYNCRKTRIALLHSQISDYQEPAISFLKVLRKSRPDADITLLSKGAEDFRQTNPTLLDHSYDLFDKCAENKQLGVEMRDLYLDVLLVLEDDPELRQIAKLSRIPQRFGIVLDGKKRNELTHSWTPEDPERWRVNPDWITFGREFGLQVDEADTNGLNASRIHLPSLP